LGCRTYGPWVSRGLNSMTLFWPANILASKADFWTAFFASP
jgi:hypothetical protein